MLQAILFDVDGTMADTERDGHRVAFNLAFREAGLDWHWDVPTYGELLAVTGGKERIRYFIDSWAPEVPDVDDLTVWIAGLHKAKTAHYLELLRQGEIPLRPGVARLIAEARQAGVRLAITTTTTPENVTGLLKATLGDDSPDWFELIAAGDIVPAKKPAADIYHYTLEQMNLSANETIALEDSANGVRSARDADVPVIVTVNDYTAGDDFDGAIAVHTDLGEPNEPAETLAGPAPEHGVIDLGYLKGLLER
ncbi:HAD-IA family hydrolase [Guyparkeria hydrothermalis]|uniref:HAD-IA family hydrolase n=1 Tax=Guyparkeria hydrothermalis TaxID=923 RepID=UPI0020212CAF|nr:HAD-IA family hydrolase [Guyparkeria hydrothermalis]MCL7745377.1 HAD-IA family hydrolase [Guyparkeria hydrothermalis]